MALFSRRKKSDSVPEEEGSAPADSTGDAATTEGKTVPTDHAYQAGGPATTEEPQAEAAPSVGISVQAFRGVGAAAGPAVELPSTEAAADAPGAAPSAAPAPAGTPHEASPETSASAAIRRLPLAAALPPQQTETVAGMKDNVLLREALKEIDAAASNEQLLGVMRQALQGHLYLRVHGDAREQISEGKPLSIAVARDGDRSFMLAFSSAGAVRDSVQREAETSAAGAVAQPVTSVLQQVVAGDFAGLILDNASAPHRVIFPTELLQKTLEQADAEMTVKSLLAAPHEADTASRVGEALARKRMWVAVNDGGGNGQVGIAEAQTADGRRFLQVFSHPLEVIALGRGDRPLPFEPEQLARVLSGHPEMAGVVVDPAGPTIIVERGALAPVLVLAVDLGA